MYILRKDLEAECIRSIQQHILRCIHLRQGSLRIHMTSTDIASVRHRNMIPAKSTHHMSNMQDILGNHNWCKVVVVAEHNNMHHILGNHNWCSMTEYCSSAQSPH